ncbi:Maf-like protein YhdE [Spirochaetota bacterium]|nr:Maf-like protein YhdE [Spirochaetota bacterium]
MQPRLPIILASKSVRRTEILTAIGLVHSQIASAIEEKRATEISDPETLVTTNARLKASAPALLTKITSQYPHGALIIGADTIVSCHHTIFEKPTDLSHAKEMFAAYAKYPATIHTALALYETKSRTLTSLTDSATLTLNKRLLTDKKAFTNLFNHIVALDKSGGFSIEGLGSVLFEQVTGSFYTVIGMPLHLLFNLLSNRNIELTSYLAK